jgi:preprotein translocase subunit SecG
MPKTKRKSAKRTVPKPFLNRTTLIFIIIFAVIGSLFLARSYAAKGGAPAVSLYLTPSSGTFAVGDSFTADIRVNTLGQPVNAVQANLVYPADKFQAVSTDYTGSVFTIQAAESLGSGTVQIARGNVEAINAPDALLAKVTFRTLSTGRKVKISFGSGSAIVRSTDNVNILSRMTSGSYTTR